jgi:hypothetical protein
MRIIATSIYFSETGRICEQHQLVAEFDAEHELPGEGAAGIAGRAAEIKAVGAGMLDAIREEISE